MKRLKISGAFLAGLLLVGFSLPARADFRLEMSGEEIRQAMGFRALEDLAVGETAPLVSLNTCSQDGGLFLYTMVGLADNAPGRTANYMATRHADRRVSIEVVSPAEDAFAVRQMIIAAVSGAHLRSCRLNGMGPDQLFRITTIGDFASDRAIFAPEP